MANTYNFISRVNISTPTTTVTFSSIPNTYSDLVILCSLRMNIAGTNAGYALLRFNGDDFTSYTHTRFRGSGSAVDVGNAASTNQIIVFNNCCSNGNESNTFSSSTIYIPGYADSNPKVTGEFHASENNTTGAYMNYQAGRWSSNAITQIDIIGGDNFSQYSSFSLYGIKNS